MTASAGSSQPRAVSPPAPPTGPPARGRSRRPRREAVFGFDHHADDRAPGTAVQPVIEARGQRTHTADRAASLRRRPGEGHGCDRLLRRLDHRDDDALRARVQHGADQSRAGLGHPHERGCATERAARRLDPGPRPQPVLGIEYQRPAPAAVGLPGLDHARGPRRPATRPDRAQDAAVARRGVLRHRDDLRARGRHRAQPPGACQRRAGVGPLPGALLARRA